MSRQLKLAILCMAIVPGWAAARAEEPTGSVLEFLGKGVQVYSCAADPSGATWKLKGPEATLRDASGHVVGQHLAGPTWQATDGSKVVGAPLVASIVRGPGAIPWLVLQATANDGTGMFAHVSYITRTRTIGGVAPATGCDAGHIGAEVRVPYSATYTFFTPAGS